MFRYFALFLYRINVHKIRLFILSLVKRFDGGEFYSLTLREIYKRYYNIEIGMYSAGGCFDLFMVDPNTKIGRYCSIAKGVRVINHNHPLSFKSTSALFFNPSFGLCSDWLIDFNPLLIHDDVWIGAAAIIMPGVNEIGTGAVIGAGTVVNKDVPPYAVVLGNPGRIVKYRFPKDISDTLLKDKWWEKNVDELNPIIKDFQKELK